MAHSFCILGAITFPIAALMAPPSPPPPSAMSAMLMRLLLYQQTGMKKYMLEIAGIIKYYKMYEKITEGMGKREKKRIIRKPKWTRDIQKFSLYEFCYGDEELTLKEAELVLTTIVADLGDNAHLYPYLTAIHIQTLKHALLLSGAFFEFKHHCDFLTLGTYYLGTREEHPTYKPILPLIEAKTRLKTLKKEVSSVIGIQNDNFGSPTHMQLAVRAAALAQKHEITKSADWKLASLMGQCYMAQSLGFKADVKLIGELVTDEDVLRQLVADLLVEVKFELKVSRAPRMPKVWLEPAAGEDEVVTAADLEEDFPMRR